MFPGILASQHRIEWGCGKALSTCYRLLSNNVPAAALTLVQMIAESVLEAHGWADAPACAGQAASRWQKSCISRAVMKQAAAPFALVPPVVQQ